MDDLTASQGVVAGNVRAWLRAEGATVLVLSVIFYSRLGLNWWIFAGLLLAPDLSMLGYLLSPRTGAICYNVVHSYLLPGILLSAAVLSHQTGMTALLTIWTAHIGMDRMLGYGLKYPTAFRNTHLGVVGKS